MQITRNILKISKVRFVSLELNIQTEQMVTNGYQDHGVGIFTTILKL
jgi:hypothetical protein